MCAITHQSSPIGLYGLILSMMAAEGQIWHAIVQ